ncbi:glycosyltransferase family 2 protein [Qiania dongpingensis]|uniref:Glycosyltransferase family 2 protein n=1 Tax=Qiania dongpingensis TaxID=2763669 RepID=A0A7G9G7I8_9FIRM|nr:glycosyltransferase family 2 protein [Qiania dongpingensis]QNM06770.1 glycosyltransferase family 2 protein [Qiania dongpingensis]
MISVDIIVPCYNEEEVLETFYKVTEETVSAMAGYQFTYIFVDDGSRDTTLAKIHSLAKAHANVRYLSFSRNFGKEAAMFAGLQHSFGDLVIVMDADLQHPPAMIPEMMKGIEEGYDCAAAMRSTRQGESRFRSVFSNLFYKISNKMSDVKMPQAAVDFRIMTRQMVNSILKLSEVERFSKGIFAWVGYETKWYPYENVERTMGTTKWSFKGLFKYAIDGITSFSISPLRLVSGMGFLISIVAFVYIIVTLIQTLIFGIDVPGYVTTLCAVLFLGGIIELSIGILGEYIAHIYMEAKDRPIYIVKQSNIEDSKERGNGQ